MVNGNFHIGSIPTSISIEGICRWFGDTCAVNQLSFDVRQGEVVGFIGPNGAGKTSTMRILSTLDEPDWGDAFVDGFSVLNDPDRVRGRLGFMPDTYGGYPHVTCIEYLDFFARAYGLVGRERIESVRRVLDFTHMHTLADKPTTGLSKGMKQRLCLGRSLIHNPSVLILDEPAAGLDPRARIELKEMIGSLAADGKSILISSHILTELAEMCDRVAIIEHGDMLGVGTVKEILSGLHDRDIDSERSSAQVTLLVEVTANAEGLANWLIEHGFQSVECKGLRVHVTLGDCPREQADLLRQLVVAGFSISKFSAKERTLEEAFLHVTRGRVQ